MPFPKFSPQIIHFSLFIRQFCPFVPVLFSARCFTRLFYGCFPTCFSYQLFSAFSACCFTQISILQGLRFCKVLNFACFPNILNVKCLGRTIGLPLGKTTLSFQKTHRPNKKCCWARVDSPLRHMRLRHTDIVHEHKKFPLYEMLWLF